MFGAATAPTLLLAAAFLYRPAFANAGSRRRIARSAKYASRLLAAMYLSITFGSYANRPVRSLR